MEEVERNNYFSSENNHSRDE